MKRFGLITFILSILLLLTQILRSPLSILSYEKQFFLGLDGFRVQSVQIEQENEEEILEIKYLVGGFGSPIVLVHGLVDNKEGWSDILQIVGQKHRVIAIDLPAHGESDPQHGTTSIPFMIEALHRVIEQEAQITKKIISQLEKKLSKDAIFSANSRITLTEEEQLQIDTDFNKITLVGHGLGGWIVGEYALHHPETIQQVFFVNPQSSNIGVSYEKLIPSSEEDISKKIQYAFGRQIWMPNFLIKDILHVHQRSMYTDLFHESLNLLPLENFIQNLDQPVQNILTEQISTESNTSSNTNQQKRIGIHVLWGTDDEIFDIQLHGKPLANISPNIGFHTLSDCGHAPQYGCPSKLGAQIESLIEK